MKQLDIVVVVVPEEIDWGLWSASSSLEEKTSFRRGVRLSKEHAFHSRRTISHLSNGFPFRFIASAMFVQLINSRCLALNTSAPPPPPFTE